MQAEQPQHPLGYLLEAEALWWRIWCTSAEFKYGMNDARHRQKLEADRHYLQLAEKISSLAEAQIKQHETAEAQFYAGMADAAAARLYGLRGENRNAARAGVSARAEMLRALELDPQMTDATAALGVYNYYVDTLSPVVRLMRIFMGIPGGNKEEGIRQMELGMNQGVFLSVDARFILARSLRTYDQNYQRALSVAEPLVTRYPQNPIFQLLLGNLNAELGRKEKASEYFHEALRLTTADAACGGCAGCDTDCSTCLTRLRGLADSSLAALH